MWPTHFEATQESASFSQPKQVELYDPQSGKYKIFLLDCYLQGTSFWMFWKRKGGRPLFARLFTKFNIVLLASLIYELKYAGYLPGEGSQDYFKYGKLLLDGNEEEFVQDLILQKHKHQPCTPQPADTTSLVQLNRNHEPTHSNQFAYAPGSFPSLSTSRSIPSRTLPRDPDITIIEPSFQTETKQPNSSEQLEITPSGPATDSQAETTHQKEAKPKKRPPGRLMHTLPPRPQKRLKGRLEEILLLSNNQLYTNPTRVNHAFATRLATALPTQQQAKKIFAQKYPTLPLVLIYSYSTKDRWLIGVNQVLSRAGVPQSEDTLKRCFSQLSSSSFLIFRFLAKTYPMLVGSDAHELMTWILETIFGTPTRRPIIGIFHNPEKVDMEVPLTDEMQRILIYFFSTAPSTGSAEVAIILIGKYLMEKRPEYWRMFFPDFQAYLKSMIQTQKNINPKVLVLFCEL
jgi:hypothetical protein